MADQPHIIDDGFSEPEQVRKIFVGNLPYEADEGMGTAILYIQSVISNTMRCIKTNKATM